ncbi:MAG: hydroxyacylglutathione hydrolase [Thiotrichales bacterium]|nr:hydroxyacylglutathione hydrolase [Thiotrichales bacterium]
MREIIGIPSLVGDYDNYIWVLYDSSIQQAWVFDPGEAQPVLAFLNTNHLALKAILITHRHFDHVDGIPELKAAFPSAIVYGPQKTPNALIDVRLQEGDQVTVSPELAFDVLETPGHTEDHISYVNADSLFCADTLFTGGCGRLLGGTPQQYAESLLKLRQLPDELDFFCAHEYTVDNLRFACYVDPENPALQARSRALQIDYPRALNQAPNKLGLEKSTNPFLRFDLPPLRDKLRARGCDDTPASLFAGLRAWKDQVDQGVEKIE